VEKLEVTTFELFWHFDILVLFSSCGEFFSCFQENVIITVRPQTTAVEQTKAMHNGNRWRKTLNS